MEEIVEDEFVAPAILEPLMPKLHSAAKQLVKKDLHVSRVTGR